MYDRRRWNYRSYVRGASRMRAGQGIWITRQGILGQFRPLWGIFGANHQFKDTLLLEGRGYIPLPHRCAPGFILEYFYFKIQTILDFQVLVWTITIVNYMEVLYKFNEGISVYRWAHNWPLPEKIEELFLLLNSGLRKRNHFFSLWKELGSMRDDYNQQLDNSTTTILHKTRRVYHGPWVKNLSE